jgi:hypothetical protein
VKAILQDIQDLQIVRNLLITEVTDKQNIKVLNNHVLQARIQGLVHLQEVVQATLDHHHLAALHAATQDQVVHPGVILHLAVAHQEVILRQVVVHLQEAIQVVLLLAVILLVLQVEVVVVLLLQEVQVALQEAVHLEGNSLGIILVT